MGVTRRELTLRAKLFLAMATLVAAAAAAPVVFLPPRLEEQAWRHLEGRALDLARALGAASEAPLDFGDRVRATKVLEGLAATKGAAYGLLLRDGGDQLASWGPAPVPLPPLDAADRPRTWRSDAFLHVALPIQTAGGERAVLRLGLHLDELRQRRAESREVAALAALAVLLVGVAAAFAVGTVLTRSVRRLSEVAERISRGEAGAAAGLAEAQSGETRTVASALGTLLEQVSAQRALATSLTEASSEGILTLGLRGQVLTHNRRLAELWSLAPGDLTATPWSAVRSVLGAHLEEPLPAWLRDEIPELPGGQPQSFDLVLRDRRYFAVHAAPVRDERGRSLGLGLYFRDLTGMKRAEERVRSLNLELESRVEERTRELAAANQELAGRLAELRRTQEQLVVADRRIAVGRLAAGVAHEINNPLAYVATNLQYVSGGLAEVGRALASDDPCARGDGSRVLEELGKAIAESIEGADRVARIVRGLRAFSRPDEAPPSPIEIDRALDAALDMAAHEIRHRARVERDYRPSPRVSADPVRLQQVFLNLLINAAQAIPPGSAEQNAIRVSVGTDAAGWAVAEVVDTGSGIPPEVLGHIFDPFFTTKPQGQGTGLGLSISQGIVITLGGRIEVKSQVGRGSTFRVVLPPTEQAPLPAPPPLRLVPAPPRPLRVLLVDDEPNLVASLERALAAQVVETATSGREALALVEGGRRYDRILCDLMMPAMTGMALLAELERIAPEQAAAMVFMTGGLFTEEAAAFADRHQERCLAKPFTLETLRKVLDVRR